MPDHTFTTYPFSEIRPDPCPNAHVRQQRPPLLPDCRAYELVSAANTGGYNVSRTRPRSNSVRGLPPRRPRPLRRPLWCDTGPWNPTNRGVDPYLATRGAHGWSTDYVGIPANDPHWLTPFASTVEDANPS